MKKNYKKMMKTCRWITGRKFASSLFLAMTFAFVSSRAQTVVTFAFTGSVQTFTVPNCVTQVTLEVWGAEGGGSGLSGNTASGFGGKGGYAKGSLAVSAGNVFNVYVGGYGQSS